LPVRILICDPVDDEGVEKLRNARFKVDVKPSISGGELAEAISEYDVVVVRSRTKVTRNVIERGKRLKIVARAGSGLDNIDLKAAEDQGVTVLNTPEAASDSVAELTIGLMLAVSRRIVYADRTVKDGQWLKKDLEGSLLKGKTLGLVGLGNIGSKVAAIARAMGMKILITKRTPPSHKTLRLLGAEFVPLEQLLRRSDVVSVHVPLTDQTAGMIGAEELSLMKDGAVLVNTARGGIVEETALLAALKSKRLGGAALDVYEVEPPVNLELLRMLNVVCTPHIGAQTAEAQKTASILLAEKIIRFFKEHSG
jgi:D-3-phosphoglycerate dehydrogenase